MELRELFDLSSERRYYRVGNMWQIMKIELTREELLLLRHCVEFNTTGNRQGNFPHAVERMLKKLNRELAPHSKQVA